MEGGIVLFRGVKESFGGWRPLACSCGCLAFLHALSLCTSSSLLRFLGLSLLVSVLGRGEGKCEGQGVPLRWCSEGAGVGGGLGWCEVWAWGGVGCGRGEGESARGGGLFGVRGGGGKVGVGVGVGVGVWEWGMCRMWGRAVC